MHYSILEQLENDTTMDRFQKAVKQNMDTVAEAIQVLKDQKAELDRIYADNRRLSTQNIRMRQQLEECHEELRQWRGEELFKNEDYPNGV